MSAGFFCLVFGVFLEAGLNIFFIAICGSHEGITSSKSTVTSVILRGVRACCVSLFSVCGCQRYGQAHLFFYEWTW